MHRTDTAARRSSQATGDGAGRGTGKELLPSISQPKGGGAIRSVGEKFAANPVRGSGAMSVPIALSPGRGGFGPQVTLSYDSEAGNGPFGFGWSLSLPRVARKTDRGVPRYRDEDESDVFVLSGAEDLVPVLDRTLCRHETRDQSAGYVIQRYRPRVEGLFARIERWTEIATGDVHWRTITRENVTTLYGRTVASRICDPAEPNRVFEWLICEAYDDKGNAMVYDYVADDDVGLKLPRRVRCASANRYLKRIRYGNRVSRLIAPDLSSAQWLFEAVFDYDEDHVCTVPPEPGVAPDAQHVFVRASTRPARSWPQRPDPFFSCRAGFEIWTHRRCRRVLMFHHFEELGAGPTLVRSTEFDYADPERPFSDVDGELLHEGSTRLGSFLSAATQFGHVRQENGTFLTKSLPPVEFSYSKARICDEVREVDAASLENLPAGAAAPTRWVDLDGEGMPGLLTVQGAAWHYKPNLGNGHFGPSRILPTQPSLAAGNGAEQFMDLSGDGQLDLVEMSGPTAGFYERDFDGGWEGFRSFSRLPNIDWDDPFTSLVDLTGDGHADAIVTAPTAFTWFPSLQEEGFAAPEAVVQEWAAEDGPQLLFHDALHAMFFADMNGDGLPDLVRIGNGDVAYWPSLGHGRFGPMVAMDNAPWFDPPDQFDRRRLQLADIDGSGTTDIIYPGRSGVNVYFNRTGIGWIDARPLVNCPPPGPQAEIATADLLGNGTACLVWSSPLTGSVLSPMRYLDLMGGEKPHLLIRFSNNMGAETRIEYAPSTRFYLADRDAGRPWITRLPFPVHVVERVETFDHIGRNQFTTRFVYHHGHFDGAEREFCGFGVVEQIDTEALAALTPEGRLPASNADDYSHVPPVLTRSFFHTGLESVGGRVSDYFAGPLDGHGPGGYFREPGLDDAAAQELLLPDTVLPDGLSPQERREACRALRGSLLRQEVYALDGGERSELPYAVTERNYAVRMLQPHGGNQHAVFLVHDREQLTFSYERAQVFVRDGRITNDHRDPKACCALDPRIAHTITLESDDFGNVLKAASIGYGRRHTDPALPELVQAAQATVYVTLSDTRMSAPVDEPNSWRGPAEFDVRTYELTGYQPTGPGGRFRAEDFVELQSDGTMAALFDAEIAFEAQPGEGRQRRLLGRRLIVYRQDDLSGPLPLGRLGTLGLVHESYAQALTPGLVQHVFGDRLDDHMLQGAGYVRPDGLDWWIPTGRVYFSPRTDDGPEQELAHARENFFLPCRARDLFHTSEVSTESFVRYDRHRLLVYETEDPLGNRVTVGERESDDGTHPASNGHDYRVLLPALVMDPNRNRVAVTFDALGMVAGNAVMGKPEDNPAQGDKLTPAFRADLTREELDALLDDPEAAAPALLDDATSRTVYDAEAFIRTRDHETPAPVYAATVTREAHVGEIRPGEAAKIRTSFAYADGFGREIQMKLPAEPEKLSERRWTGTGWIVFNNKGKPIRRYEPFFSHTHRFEFDVRAGRSPVIFYDPLSRVVGTLFPDRTWNKSVFGPWRAEVWDVGDTVGFDAPQSDPDLGDFFTRLDPHSYLPGWHASRIGGGLGHHEQVAALKAEICFGTPTTTHSDSLGRTVLTVSHNRTPTPDGTTDEFLASRVTLDIQGNQREVLDSVGRVVMRYDYDMASSIIASASMEAGCRHMLGDAAGKPLYAWDDRDHAMRSAYDALQRPVASFLRDGDGPEITITCSVYGEDRADALSRNLRGRLVELRDQAGILTTDRFDFKGNALESSRRLVTGYRDTVDWSTDAPCEAWSYTSRTRYDALDRPVQMIPPRGPENSGFTVVQPVYNEANMLERLDVWMDRDAVPENLLGAAAEPAAHVGVAAVEYDEMGRRRRIEYRNGTSTDYHYDPDTLHLIRLRTRRGRRSLQDLHFTYDPTGNIIRIGDAAQPDLFFRNSRVEPTAEYTYDAMHRLIEATGREHLGQNCQPRPYSPDDRGRIRLPHPQDGAAMGRYRERYAYDPAGNMIDLRHLSLADPAMGWTRHFSYEEPSLLDPTARSNRLTAVITGGTREPIGGPGGYDAHGNMLHLPHITEMAWNFADQLQMSRRQTGRGDEGRSWYVYDAGGQRVRKVTEGARHAIRHERIYFDGFEIYRRHGRKALTRETLHVMDDQTRVALVETRTSGKEPGVPARLIRYQVADHLGASRLELDDRARIVSVEEYSPWRSTTYQAVRSQTQTPKRYRAGKERDVETGFYYHGARYYAPWLCRWMSCDPQGIRDGHNLYQFVGSNPVKLIDPTGENGQGGPFNLGDLILYADKVANKAQLGANIQKDHAISQKIITTILGPFAKLYKPGRDLTTIVDTGAAAGSTAARWHTVKSTLERGIQAAVSSRVSRGISLADDVIEPVSNVLKQASNAQLLSRPQYLGMLSQLGNMHVLNLDQTSKLLPIIRSGDTAKLTAEIDKLANSRTGSVRHMRTMRGIVAAENALPRALAAPTALQRVMGAVAPVAKVVAPVAKVVAPVARVAAKAAGPLGLAFGIGKMATADNAEDAVDGAITATSSALMMSPHPVAKAAGGGLMAGQLIDKATGASDVASSVGISVKEGLEDLGVNDTAAFVAGGVATVAAVPISIPVGAAKTVHHRLTSDEYTLVPWKSQLWSDIFD